MFGLVLRQTPAWWSWEWYAGPSIRFLGVITHIYPPDGVSIKHPRRSPKDRVEGPAYHSSHLPAGFWAQHPKQNWEEKKNKILNAVEGDTMLIILQHINCLVC